MQYQYAEQQYSPTPLVALTLTHCLTPQNGSVPFIVSHYNWSLLFSFSVASQFENTQKRILSLCFVQTHPSSLTLAVRDFDDTSGCGTIDDWCISGVSWID